MSPLAHAPLREGSGSGVTSTYLSIRVELVAGRGVNFWPRPGRVFVTAPWHSFAQLARAIDLAFGRWDLDHLHVFSMDGGSGVRTPDWWDGQTSDDALDGRADTLSRLNPGQQFAYVFDMGDEWTHLCTVVGRAHPGRTTAEGLSEPSPYWGWGDLPDQFGRRWEGDDGRSSPPIEPCPTLSDLPPILRGWGEGQEG